MATFRLRSVFPRPSHHHSLRWRLTVLLCTLLAAVLSAFLWAANREIEGTLVKAGGERAQVAADQLALLLERSTRLRMDDLRRAAADATVRRYAQTPTEEEAVGAHARVARLATAGPQSIAIWSDAGTRLLDITIPARTATDAVPVAFPPGRRPVREGVSELRAVNHVVISEGVAAITAAPTGDPMAQVPRLGYLVVRSIISVSPPGLIAGLVGRDATVAIGNTADNVWTDLSTDLAAPRVDVHIKGIKEYDALTGDRRLGAVAMVGGTPWAVWIEFPKASVVAPARALLRRGILLGLICLAFGAVCVGTLTLWTTRHLQELSDAAEDIAAGNYSRRVVARGRDEIGLLAGAFNAMAGRVQEAYLAVTTTHDQTRFALDAAHVGVWEIDLASNVVTWSDTMAAIFGVTSATAPTTVDTSIALLHPDDRAAVRSALEQAITLKHDYAAEFRAIWPDDSTHWVNSRARLLYDATNTPVRLLGVGIDITDRKVLEEALFDEKERAQVTLNSIGDGVLSTDLSGRVTYLNGVAERMTGWPAAEALGQPVSKVFDIHDGPTRERAQNPLEMAVRLSHAVTLPGSCVLIGRDGGELPIEDSAAPIRDRSGRVTGAVIVFHDVTVTRTMTLQLSHLAKHDKLTDLPNRTVLNDRLSQAIGMAHRQRTRLAVLFVDLDRFKHVNDSLGHAMGDLLLQSVAHRLETCVRSSDTVSRQGGDEFVVLLAHIEHAEDAARIAEKIIAELAVTHRVADHDLEITTSIGVSIYPDDAMETEALINAADAAMYQAKENGRSNYQFYTLEMNTRAIERQLLERSLRGAVERQELVLHYQPKMSLETGAMTGIEALVRWRHPQRGLVSPREFVPIAEECGLIVPIGQWVLREACRQARAWQDAGLPPLPMAVNVSAVEFRAKGFLAHVRAVLEETRLEPRYLELELTESVLMADAESTTAMLQALKVMGVQLAVDDFGTGYSSLSYLSRFPIDTLKIDQSFVQGIDVGRVDAPIVRAVISMGRSLNQRVVAEGIETEEQLAVLHAQRCGEGQGYFFSPPLVAEEFSELLAAGLPSRASQALKRPIGERATASIGFGGTPRVERRVADRRSPLPIGELIPR